MNTLISLPSSVNQALRDIRLKLEFSRYRPQTIKAYLGQLRIFFRYLSTENPSTIGEKDIRRYLDHLVQTGASRSRFDQAVNALDFFFRTVLGGSLDLSSISRPAKKRSEPVVLTVEEVKKIATAAENLKHRLMMELAYTAGLRVSELVRVRVQHVDLSKLKLFVPDEDNRGGRHTIFSASLRDALARQIGNKRPGDYLFPSERGGCMTTRAVAKFFKCALISSGVDKPATPHSLRHSFEAFMLEKGTNPDLVRTLLGRKTKVKAE